MRELKINVNDDDIAELMEVYKTNDEVEAVRMAISESIKKQAYARILSLQGKVEWEGNLDEMRAPRI